MRTRVLAAVVVLASVVSALLMVAGPASASTRQATGDVVVTATVTSAHGRPQTVRAAGPTGEYLLCDRFYAFADKAGELTLQHQCGGNTAPWGYRIAPPLRTIAVSPVSEQGMDWTRNGVRQPRLAPHVEGVDYIFHGTFPNSPDGSVISYSDHYSFRHGVSGGGDVNIDIKGTFTLTGNRA